MKKFKNMFKKKPQLSAVPGSPQPTAPRAKEEIDKEYSGLCAKAGELGFQLKAFQDQLNRIHNQIYNLAAEAEQSEKLAAEKAAKEEVKDVADGSNDTPSQAS